MRAGRSGFLYTALGIAFALIVGTLLGKLLAVPQRPAFLISTGTAICGGSAIAAVGPITGATEDEMSVSLGTIFMLNSIALLTFPTIGLMLKLSQNQFGLWAALAIHDTSSVVGASAKYGAVALAVGTTVKLARALWIVPLSIGTAAVKGSKTRIQWPWFILFFCLAAVANTYFHPGAAAYHFLSNAGKADAGHHAVPDRRQPVAGGVAQGWSAAAAARRGAVDHRRRGQPAGDSGGVDRDLATNDLDWNTVIVYTGFA